MPTRGRDEGSGLWGEVRRARPGRGGGDVAESDPKTQKVLDLQQAAGNAAVTSAVQRSFWGGLVEDASSWLGGDTGGKEHQEAEWGGGGKAVDEGWGDKDAGGGGGKVLDEGWGDKDPGGGAKFDDGGWKGDQGWGDKDQGGGAKFDDGGWKGDEGWGDKDAGGGAKGFDEGSEAEWGGGKDGASGDPGGGVTETGKDSESVWIN